MNLAPTGCDDIHNRKRLILLLRAKIRKKDTSRQQSNMPSLTEG